MRVCLARGRGEARRPACGSDSVSPERPSRVPRGGAAFPCSSVHDTAVYRARTHTHVRGEYIRGFIRGRARTPGPRTRTHARGIVERLRVRARGTRACAAIHTPVPLFGEGHTPISGDRGDRDSSTTRACLSKPSRVSKSTVRGASYRAAISFPLEERGREGEREKERKISSGISYESSSITGFYHWNRGRRRSWITVG